MKKNEKAVKTGMMISFASLLLGIAGVMVHFAQTMQFDAAGCGILACNTVIFSDYLVTYYKIKNADMNVQ